MFVYPLNLAGLVLWKNPARSRGNAIFCSARGFPLQAIDHQVRFRGGVRSASHGGVGQLF